MKKHFIISILALVLLTSCNKDKEILNTLNNYNLEMVSTGYHFGDKITLPKEVTDEAESISLRIGEKEIKDLKIDPSTFTLGDNDVVFVVKKKDGKVLEQDATINVFAKNPEAQLTYTLVTTYPHNPDNFVQGFELEGNTIYESDGQLGESQILKYQLGTTTPIVATKQGNDIFSEGSTIVGDKIFQLTWQNKIIYEYEKSSLKLIKEYPNPSAMEQGWGLTYDGKNLIASDGSKNLYFLDVTDPSKLVRYVSVAGNSQVYEQLNELEFHNGFVYANVWHEPIILKINPATGEVVGKFDFTEIAKKYTETDGEKVLNGITFKGDNMLVTGKNWDTIYEVKIN